MQYGRIRRGMQGEAHLFVIGHREGCHSAVMVIDLVEAVLRGCFKAPRAETNRKQAFHNRDTF
jgi:hypothetical protein